MHRKSGSSVALDIKNLGIGNFGKSSRERLCQSQTFIAPETPKKQTLIQKNRRAISAENDKHSEASRAVGADLALCLS
jgi:hypothetical protein